MHAGHCRWNALARGASGEHHARQLTIPMVRSAILGVGRGSARGPLCRTPLRYQRPRPMRRIPGARRVGVDPLGRRQGASRAGCIPGKKRDGRGQGCALSDQGRTAHGETRATLVLAFSDRRTHQVISAEAISHRQLRAADSTGKLTSSAASGIALSVHEWFVALRPNNAYASSIVFGLCASSANLRSEAFVRLGEASGFGRAAIGRPIQMVICSRCWDRGSRAADAAEFSRHASAGPANGRTPSVVEDTFAPAERRVQESQVLQQLMSAPARCSAATPSIASLRPASSLQKHDDSILVSATARARRSCGSIMAASLFRPSRTRHS